MSFSDQLPARIAAQKILKNLETEKPKVLDVGCGDGDLMADLGQAGCACTGLEKSAENAVAAKARGMDIRIATWPYFDEGGFDAILFIRALHHIKPLEAAIKKAKSLLTPGGFVFVDDFAFADANETISAWMYELLKLLHNQNLIDPSRDEFISEVFESGGFLEPWKKDYVNDLNSAGDMAEVLEKSFSSVKIERVPYLYRYVTRTLVDGPGKDQLARKIYDMESKAGAEYPSILIGRHFLAR